MVSTNCDHWKFDPRVLQVAKIIQKTWKTVCTFGKHKKGIVNLLLVLMSLITNALGLMSYVFVVYTRKYEVLFSQTEVDHATEVH